MSKSIDEVVAEAKKRAQAEADARRDKIDALVEDTKRRREDEAARERAAVERRRVEGEERFERDLEAEARAMFFAGNSGAPEMLYQTVREKLRRQILAQRSEAAVRNSLEQMRRSL